MGLSLLNEVMVYEVGPREGFQIEDGPISTENKIKLIDMLSETGLKSIEVASFVSPKWVPQMADADSVLTGINKKRNVQYRTVYLNLKGLERAINHNVSIDGVLLISASDIFSKRNTNKSIEETLKNHTSWIEAYKQFQIPVDSISVMAAFGCNFKGDISVEELMNIIRIIVATAEKNSEEIKKVKLADTMGWANPNKIKQAIHSIKNEWPDLEIILHLHDTRGLGLANAYAALQEGVTHFETAIGGLGGCPYAAVKGAAGNIATEDFVFMCEELGVQTNVSLSKLLDCTKLAEKVFGRSLPAHLITGGLLKH